MDPSSHAHIFGEMVQLSEFRYDVLVNCHDLDEEINNSINRLIDISSNSFTLF